MIITKHITLFIKFVIVLFFISAFYGWLMRLSAIYNFKFIQYNRLLQSHSHVTFLGWGFMTITILFNALFLDVKIGFSKFYKWLFGIEFLSIGLMLISFPLQGYKVFSIILLSTFLITSYVYSVRFLKDLKQKKHHSTLLLFIKSSFIFYIISSIGIWAIGIVVATQGKTDLYYNSIYFYLHFLYNGFFVFALFALFFRYLVVKNIDFNLKHYKLFFIYFFIACIPAYSLSLVNSANYLIIILGFISSLLQLIGLYYLFKIINFFKIWNQFKTISKLFLFFILLSFSLKTILQFGSAFPQLSVLLTSLKSYFVIGYIHLVTLGFISSFLFLLLIEFNIINVSKKLIKLGLYLFLLGVLLTEITLFTQGVTVLFFKFSLPFYSTLIFIESTLLLIGLFLILIRTLLTTVRPEKRNTTTQNTYI